MTPNRQYDHLFAELAKPFPDEKVLDKKPGKPHYITAKMVMNRLDTVLGPMNWWDEYQPGGEDSVLCRLTVQLPDGSTVTKCDAGGFKGMANDGDDDKSGYSDAFKRAAVKFGVGRYLNGNSVPVYHPRDKESSGVTGDRPGPVQVASREDQTGTMVPPQVTQEPVQEAPEQTQERAEPESKGLDGNPFRGGPSFWNEVLDEVARVNAQWLGEKPDSEDVVTTDRVLMFLAELTHDGKVQPVAPLAENGPDGKPMTMARWAGVMNKVARKSPEMEEWLRGHMKAFCAKQLQAARSMEKRGVRGKR